MGRAHFLRAAGLSVLATLLSCHIIGGAGDLEFTDGTGTGGGAGSGGVGGGPGGGGQGGGGQGGSSTCDNGLVDPGELCFSSPFVAYETGKQVAADMVLIDCDGDDDLDVITADEQSQTFTVLTNDGAGVLEIKQSTPSGYGSPVRIALADLDGAGNLDIIVAGNNLGSGPAFAEWSTEGCVLSGGVVTPGLSGAPQDVAALQFGGDIIDDPVATVAGGQGPWLGYRDSFPQPHLAQIDAGTTEVAGIAAGRLDGNDTVDIAFVDPNQNVLLVRSNTGTTFALAASYDVGNGPLAVAIGTLDGDDANDIVVANTAANTVSILINDGSGGFTKPGPDLAVAGGTTVAAKAPRDVTLADIDADGDLDILTANGDDSPTTSQSSVSVFLNDGDGGFQLATTEAFPAVQLSFPVEVGLLPQKVWVADMNGDGAVDIVTAGAHVISGVTSQVSVLLANP
jgi:hypothetical protein